MRDVSSETGQYFEVPTWLSPSKVKAYMACPKCFEMQYLQNKKPDWSRANIALPLGNGFHSGVEHARITVLTRDLLSKGVAAEDVAKRIGMTDRKGVISDEFEPMVKGVLRNMGMRTLSSLRRAGLRDRELPLPFTIQECLDAGRASFKKEAERFAEVTYEYSPYKAWEEAYEDIDTMVETMVNRVVIPQEIGYGIAGVEEKVRFTRVFPGGIIFDGIMDCRLEDSQKREMIIKDMKTKGAEEGFVLTGKETPAELDKKIVAPTPEEIVQITIYAYYYWKQDYDVKIQIDQIIKVPPFPIIQNDFSLTKANYEEAYNLVIDVAHAIKSKSFPAKPNAYCKFDHGRATPEKRIIVPENYVRKEVVEELEMGVA